MEAEFAFREVRTQISRVISRLDVPEKIVDGIGRFEDVVNAIESTILHGESNSFLLSGGSWTGKTLCLRKALKHASELNEQYIEVKLDGRLCNDNRDGVILILEQLIKNKNKNCNANIGVNKKGEEVQFGDLADKLYVKLTEENAAPLLIVIENFEKLAQLGVQTLLYCLFDAIHNTARPIILLATSRVHNVMNLLEKRVRSRFSHRKLTFHFPQTLEEYVNILKASITPHSTIISKYPTFSKNFINEIEKTFSDKKVLQMCENQLESFGSVETFFSMLWQVLSKITKESPYITKEKVLSAFNERMKIVNANLIADLSLPEVVFLMVAIRLFKQPSYLQSTTSSPYSDKGQKYRAINFEGIFSEIFEISNTQQFGSLIHADKEQYFKAFINLVSLKVISFVPKALAWTNGANIGTAGDCKNINATISSETSVLAMKKQAPTWPLTLSPICLNVFTRNFVQLVKDSKKFPVQIEYWLEARI